MTAHAFLRVRRKQGAPHLGGAWRTKYRNPEFVGGALSFRPEDYVACNGYANDNWGWGLDDEEIALRMVEAGLKIVYLTGRDETMRSGTEESLRAFGFPLDGEDAKLILKPDFKVDDTVFKGQALEALASDGEAGSYIGMMRHNARVIHDGLSGDAAAQ